GRRDVPRILDTNTECTHILGQSGEIHLVVRPQFARLRGLLTAIGTVEAALGLVAAAVVVDDGDGRNIPAHSGLYFADVIPEAGVAGENDDGPLRTRGFRPDAGGKCPAQVPGAAHVALRRCAQIVHAAHPHSGVAGVNHDDGVVGHVLAQLAADARR